MKIRRSLLTVFVVAATLVGCGTPDIDTDAKEIKFGEATTRAEVDSADDILEFKVFAEMNLGADGTAEASQWIPILENEKVYRTSTSSPFIYDHTRYWVENRKFNFFAVYPYDTAVTVNDNGSGNDSYSIHYTTPETADLDFLYASKPQETEVAQSEYPTVTFELQHITSKIKFEITRDGNNNQMDKFLVDSVKISYVKKSGTVTASPTNTLGSWVSDDETLNFTKKYSTPEEIGLNGDPKVSDKLTPWEDGLLVLPQSVQARQIMFQIFYQYQVDGNNPSVTNPATPEKKEITAWLPAIEWASNSSYLYKLTLKETNLITFSQIEVAGWGSNITGGTIIIK